MDAGQALRFTVYLLPALVAHAAHAQDFPAKAIKIVVPFPAGAATDSLARTVAADMNKAWGQPVIVENRAGATGTIGSSYVSKSPPDGYTLLMATTSTHSIAPNLYKVAPYDAAKDFAGVSLVAWTPNVLIVHPALPVKTVKELVALAKARPGQLLFASSGAGSSIHLAGELFKSMAQINMVHVPYKGAAPAIAELVGGQVQLMFDTVAQSLPFIQAGRLRALAVTTSKRATALPNVPTMQEAGMKNYEMAGWIGLLAPPKTPAEIINKLHGQVAKMASNKELKDRWSSQGAELVGSSPSEMTNLIVKEVPKYAQIMRAAGMEPE